MSNTLKDFIKSTKDGEIQELVGSTTINNNGLIIDGTTSDQINGTTSGQINTIQGIATDCSLNNYTTMPYYSYTYTIPENFDLQIKQVKNGFKIKVGSDEFVFESIDGMLKFIKESVKGKKK